MTPQDILTTTIQSKIGPKRLNKVQFDTPIDTHRGTIKSAEADYDGTIFLDGEIRESFLTPHQLTDEECHEIIRTNTPAII